MACQIVMDHTGDTRHEFSLADAEAVKAAEERFKELTGLGFRAAVRTGPGERQVIKKFDPTHEDVMFFPHLVGG